jgi:CubicO group peptidase (beta-lactamase class C family)
MRGLNLPIGERMRTFSVTTLRAVFFASLAVGTALHAQSLPNTTACKNFAAFATQGAVDPRYISSSHKALEPFKTDTLWIQQAGQKLWSWNDPLYTSQSPRIQWSISKMITVTLLGATIEAGTQWQGQPVTLETKVSDLFPNPGAKVESNAEHLAKYRKLTLGHLAEMSANFEWKEYYDSKVDDSSFLPMLYMLRGFSDIPAFALNQPFNTEAPGERWVYSGGNANILMAALEKIHAGRPDFINELLFAPLGITSWRLERDQKGHGIGSSYFYLSSEDMARFGQLFLDQGLTPNGQRVLSEDWVQESQELTPSILKEATSVDIIKKLGAGSRRLFWLNQDIVRDGKVIYPQEFPEAPSDLYFAAGHYGQLILVIPSHDMVITRTGHDLYYWDHIQPLAVKALSCFVPGFVPNPVDDLTPPSAGEKKNAIERGLDSVGSLPGMIQTVNFLRDSGVAQTVLAKELCSFVFTQGLETRLPESKAVSTYKARSGLPSAAQTLLLRDLKVQVDYKTQTATVRTDRLIPNPVIPMRAVQARYFGGHEGCRITRAWKR